jgi:long-chain fatty acid transport protein
MKKLLPLSLASLIVASAAIDVSHATNGMDLEAYGPIAMGMGGVSLAYNNGTAAVANNPATLSLMEDGETRLDIAFGLLSPHIKSSVPGGPEANSSANAFFMPALGWAQRKGQWTYGFGIFGQGGMGTHYSDTSFLALNSGDTVRSEVSVGRFILPLSYAVNEKFSIGGSLDLLWAGMDLKMAMRADQGMQLITGATLPLPSLKSTDYMRIDFSDDNQMTGEAKGYGTDVKIGATYMVAEGVRLGAVYQAQPSLGDLETDHATMSFGSMQTGQQGGSMSGKIKVRDFHWPALAGAGVAWNATEKLMLGFDFRYIFWADAMESMSLTFEADGGMGNVDLTLPQHWDDQAVYEVGGAYALTEAWTLRAGYNYGENPVPEGLTNPLFPAIIEQHITGGCGYAFQGGNTIDLGLSYAPKVEVTNMEGLVISHEQVSAQVMYSMFF